MTKKKLITLCFMLICIVLIFGIKIVIADTNVTGILEVHFQTDNSSIDMSGINIRCINKDVNSISKSGTMKSAIYTFPNLTVGSYDIYVDKVPNGYEGLTLSSNQDLGYYVGTADVTVGNTTIFTKKLKETDKQELTQEGATITKNQLGQTSAVASNSVGNLEITVKNTENKYVENVGISIQEANSSTQISKESDNNGEINFSNLDIGTYKVFITGAPEGYKLSDQEGYDENNGWTYYKDVEIKANETNSTDVIMKSITKTNAEVTITTVDVNTNAAVGPIVFNLYVKNGDNWEIFNNGTQYSTDSTMGKQVLYLAKGTYKINIVETNKSYPREMQGNYDIENNTVMVSDELVVSSTKDIDFKIQLIPGDKRTFRPANHNDLTGSVIGDKIYIYMYYKDVPKKHKEYNPLVYRDGFNYSQILCLNHNTRSEQGYFEVAEIVDVIGNNATVLSTQKTYTGEKNAFLRLSYVLKKAKDTDWSKLQDVNKDGIKWKINEERVKYQKYFWRKLDGKIAETLGLNEWVSGSYGTDSDYADTLAIAKEAVDFANSANNGNASIATNKTEIEYNEDTIAGPFNVEFIGNVTDIIVKDANNNQINNVTFYTDKECTQQIGLKSGTTYWDITSKNSFYIKSNSERIKSLNIKVENDVLGCKLWFLKPYNLAKNKGQNMMAFETNVQPTYAEITLTVKNPPVGKIQLNKKDLDTKENLSGAEFILYKYDGNVQGWVTGTPEDEKNYVQTKDNATKYTADREGIVNIDNLRIGKYYIYETKTSSDEYILSAQVGYDASNKWVSVANLSVEKDKTKEETVYNRKVGKIQINKKDLDTKENLSGEEVILYKYDGNNKGWVTGTPDGVKTYTQSKENASKYTTNNNGVISIDNLSIGKYYIYETKTPNEKYILSAQVGYDNTNKWARVADASVDVNKTKEETIYNRKVGKIQINKKDYDTKENLPGAEFILYKYDGDIQGWVTETPEGEKNYVQSKDSARKYTTNNNGVVSIDKLRIGKYYIYETKAPNEKYVLSAQIGYDDTNKWIPVGDISVDENNTKKQTVYNRQLGKISIKKVDENDSSKRLVAGFKIKTSNGWLRENNGKYVYDSSYEDATIFHSTDTGEDCTINDLVLGSYTFYEVEAPEGYDLTKQEGYANGAVQLETKQLTREKNEIEFTVKNKKIVNVEGYVWLENPQGKANEYNDVYNSNSEDQLLTGIKVILHENSETKETTTTNGYYKFSNIDNSELTNAYVEFIYDNKTYIACHTFVGNDNAINSKAKEHDMQVVELEDDNLTGTEGNCPGIAVTEQGKLTSYGYDTRTYTYSNINLGLKRKSNPEHAITEKLEYIKVKMKGYTYTYKYGQDPVTMSTYVPTVSQQSNSAVTFEAKIYPSDVVYNVVNSTATDKLEMYVVYSMGVTNTTTTNIDDIAVEQKLYLTSLTNTFDTDRYELSTEENGNTDENQQFKLWNAQGNKATYNLNNANSAYKDGIEKNETKTAYIQFKIKDEAIKKMLNRTLTVEDLENAPTVAETAGFHEYLRTDQLWVDSSVRKYNGAKGNVTSAYYLHKSTTQYAKAANVYLKLTLGKARTVSGTVFEDSVKNTDLKLGDGILNEQDPNRIKNVKVELLNADRNTVTSLYKVDNAGRIVYQEGTTLPKAETYSNEKGVYSLDGIVPGYYYIRFTYGDGSQKIISANGEEKSVTSNDYKSTIINTEETGARNIIKDEIERAVESQDAVDNANWYKNLNSQYSIAVDDLNMRESMDNYIYKSSKDGSGKTITIASDKDGNTIGTFPMNVYSYTPMISMPIETNVNDNNDSEEKAIFERFSFGIIEAPKTIVDVDLSISNITLTTQVGSAILSENPAHSRSKYLVSLDENEFGKSKSAKTEIDLNAIYGSDLQADYELTIKNNSDKDYIEDNAEEKGYYYKYGIVTSSAREKIVNIDSVLNSIDSKYNIDSIGEKLNVSETGNEVKVTKGSDNKIDISEWGPLARDSVLSIEYNVTGLLTQDEDSGYINKAAVSAISLDKLTTLNSGFTWPGSDTENEARLTFTPPTGKDKRNIYIISSVIGLIVLCSGIVILKKKVL